MSAGDDLWDHETDVLVVGGGMAGMAAAMAAIEAGVEVTMLERASQVGGTTAKSGGQFWIPNNSLMRAAGIEDPREPLLRLMARTAYPHLYDPSDPHLGIGVRSHALIATFYDRAGDVVDRLAAAGAIFPVLDTHTPSYHADSEDDRAPYGRSLVPKGKPKTKAEGTGGDLLILGMEKAATARGVQVLVDHRVAAVLRNVDGAVIGVEARAGLRTRLIRARRGIVFASGGFLHDRDLVREYLRGPVFGGCAADTNTGDFVRIGIELGAQLGNMNNAWWNQLVLEVALRTPSTIRDVWLPFGDSMIQVNRHGRRVVNEKMPYNERAQVHFHWDPTRREYPNLLMFMVFDQAVIDSPIETTFREPVPTPGQSLNYVISGDTWVELARRIDERLESLASHTGGVRLAPEFTENLKANVARFDEFARAGKDEDFGRGETPIQLAWGAGARACPNQTMHPFAETGPYHCIILAGGSLDTKGGPQIDALARVLDTHGAPIPGLFGAGNCVASPAGQAYWSPGGTIGPAMVFGYIAGEQAAREPVKAAE